jgi:hypothetical protein
LSDHTQLQLLGDEPRRAQVEVHVHAILIVGVLVLEIVRETEHRRKLSAGLRIEISVAAARVDRGVTQPEIGEARRVVAALTWSGEVQIRIGVQVRVEVAAEIRRETAARETFSAHPCAGVAANVHVEIVHGASDAAPYSGAAHKQNSVTEWLFRYAVPSDEVAEYWIACAPSARKLATATQKRRLIDFESN